MGSRAGRGARPIYLKHGFFIEDRDQSEACCYLLRSVCKDPVTSPPAVDAVDLCLEHRLVIEVQREEALVGQKMTET